MMKIQMRMIRITTTGRFSLGAAALWLSLALLLCGAPAWAQTGQGMKVSSGTGFFVSGHGHIVTNYHVVKGCEKAVIHGSMPDATARVVAVDKEFDLAILQTRARVRRTATIRHPDASRLKEGEPVLVMGYPGESAITRKYQIAESHVVGLRGPLGEPYWVQFADAVRQGNSGGPLLDSSGNVAGVIVAKTAVAMPFRGGNKIISESDVAVSLPYLLKFLNKHHVLYNLGMSYGFLMPTRVEELAKSYIVNILCAPGSSVLPKL